MVRLFLGRMGLIFVMPFFILGMAILLTVITIAVFMAIFFMMRIVHALMKDLGLFPTVLVTGCRESDERESSKKGGDLHE